MARPLRLQFSGAVYHVTSRGNAREDIFTGDSDRELFLSILSDTVERHNWLCHAYCLMDNHYHLLLETRDPTLSVGMRRLNGVYTQAFNRRHERTGHVFQGRYKAILVAKDAYLLELCRYVVLNPVAAGMVSVPEQWKWSSYRATVGIAPPPPFLTIDWVLGRFAGEKGAAQARYAAFVGKRLAAGDESPWRRLKGRIFFGGPQFVSLHQGKLDGFKKIREIPREQRFLSRPPLPEIFSDIVDKGDRNRKIIIAHWRYGYALKEIAGVLGLHYSTVSRVANKRE